MPASNDGDDVLSRLPRNRPARRSARRETTAAASGKTSARDPAAPAPPPGPEPDSGRRPVEPPSGGEILQSAAQAATDLAAIGLAVGREAAKAVLRRLPKP